GLCRGLGMKLLAVTPRPAAVLGALDRSRKTPVAAGAVEALLTIGPRWADLGILRDKVLLFARSLGVGPTLAAEVKRSLTVFAVLFLFGNMLLANKKAEKERLEGELQDMEKQLKGKKQKLADIEGFKTWDNTTISWLDELYDLTERFPAKRGLRITHLVASN